MRATLIETQSGSAALQASRCQLRRAVPGSDSYQLAGRGCRMEPKSVQTTEGLVEHQDLGELGERARELMLDDGPDRVAELRGGGGWMSGRDVCSIDLVAPAARDGYIDGFDGESIYRRTLFGEPGLIEAITVAIDELCDRFEGRRPRRGPRDAAQAQTRRLHPARAPVNSSR